MYAPCNAAAPEGADESGDDAELVDGFQIAAIPKVMKSNAASAHPNLQRCSMGCLTSDSIRDTTSTRSRFAPRAQGSSLRTSQPRVNAAERHDLGGDRVTALRAGLPVLEPG